MDISLLDRLTEFRHDLHRYPEFSGEEKNTALSIRKWLEQCSPTQIIDGIGGYGLAAVFDSDEAGPSIMFRCELDALPIPETGKTRWRSQYSGIAHLCGHDGHMSIVAGLAKLLQEAPPARGKIILLFQPAEETGEGAKAVVSDRQYPSIHSDYAFALHNLPGMKLGKVGIKPGPFNFASEGMSIKLTGHTSHASYPEDGNSPASAMSELICELPGLPGTMELSDDTALITVVHARLGTESYGISPGEACVMTTVRSIDDTIQKSLITQVENLAQDIAKRHGLKIDNSLSDQFAACTNDPLATDIMRTVLEKTEIEYEKLNSAFRWSEDFGVFGATTRSALCVLGAGYDCPQLHHPDYDFPDELIETGVRLFEGISREMCGG